MTSALLMFIGPKIYAYNRSGHYARQAGVHLFIPPPIVPPPIVIITELN